MGDPDLLALADANLAESHREFARFHPDGLIAEHHGLLLTRGAREHAGLNFAIRVGNVTPKPQEVLGRAQNLFAHGCRGFAVRARAHLDRDLVDFMHQQGRFRGGETVGMVRQGRFTVGPVPASVELSPVDTAARARAFAQVASTAFATEGLPSCVTQAMFSQPERLLAPHVRAFLASAGGRPASAALALLSHGIAGVYWLGTVEEARRQGLARMVLRALHNWACDQGARAVALQCAPKHVPLYAGLGYRELTRYPWFLITGGI